MSEFSDADAAALYDCINAWDPAGHSADAFFHRLVMSASAVLDVGCGTGAMLQHAREAGHRGRLVGVDPDETALDRARHRSDIEWVLGRADEMRFDAQFDLAIMASHAFQFLIGDDEVRASLWAICAALVDGGRFAFETRHPQARAWERWRPEAVNEVDFDGRRLRMWLEVESVEGGVVTLTETTANDEGAALRVDRGQLRFHDVAALNAFLAEAGFTIEAQHGDWDGSPIGPTSAEIITTARRT